MKMRIIAAALIVLAGAGGTSFAFEKNLGLLAPSLVTPITCDVRQIYKDDQATCAAHCEDQYIRDKQNLELDLGKAVTDKKACDAKCACPQNSADLK